MAAGDNSFNTPLIDLSSVNKKDKATTDLFNWHKDEFSRVTVYIDTDKRQSVAIANGIEYIAVEKILKEINSNPAHYKHQTYEKVDTLWKTRIRYLLLLMFIIILLLMFIDKIGFYVCIVIDSFIILSVITFYIVKYCNKKVWIKNEINRISNLIEQSNAMEYIYSDKYNHKKKKNNWTDYIIEIRDNNDPNNLYYVNLRSKPLSTKEKSENVVKIIIYIWLLNKNQQRKPTKYNPPNSDNNS